MLLLDTLKMKDLFVILISFMIASGCLTESKGKCKCEKDLKSVVCSSLELSLKEVLLHFIPTHVQNLTLKKSWSEESFALTASLLFKFRQLQKFDVSNNVIGEIRPFTFNFFPYLREVDLSHNRIRTLDRTAFHGYLPELKRLNLSRNKLLVLLDDTFVRLASLHHLDLSSNAIVYIAKNAMAGLISLQSLKLESWNITHLSRQILKPLVNLTSFEARKFHFVRKIQQSSFKCNTRLRVLHLSEFYQLSTEGINKQAWSGLTQLRRLTLSACNLSEVPSLALGKVINIITLDLSHNPINVVKQKDLFGLNKLEVLNLRQTGLLNIWDNAFRSLMSLKEIDVSDNRLSTLRKKSFPISFSSLKKVSLKNNPWSCDCRIKWMNTSTFPADENIVCTNPSHNRGLNLQNTNLDCESPIINNFTYSLANTLLNSAIDLVCFATGKPKPTIQIQCNDLKFSLKSIQRKDDFLRVSNLTIPAIVMCRCQATNNVGHDERRIDVHLEKTNMKENNGITWIYCIPVSFGAIFLVSLALLCRYRVYRSMLLLQNWVSKFIGLPSSMQN